MSKEQTIPESLRVQLEKLSGIPNAPFLYKAPSNYIENYAQENQFVDLDNHTPEEEKLFAKDKHGLYLRIKRGNPFYKILITSHLDHPSIIINNHNIGTQIGSIEYKTPIEHPIPVIIYSKDGKFIAKSQIIKTVKNRNTTNVIFDSNQTFGANSQTTWDLDPIHFDQEKIKMISSDDVATTAASLCCIKEIAMSTYPIDIQFAFTYVEEVRQVSATGIALHGTPFGKIDEKTLVIPLESDYVEMSDEQREKAARSKLDTANYEDGLIVRVNDNGIVYAQNSTAKNIAEELAVRACQRLNLKYQQGIMGSSCDGTSFTLFSQTPNVVCLTIPTRFKHNTNSSGDIVHEEIKKTDLLSLISVLTEISKSSRQETESTTDNTDQISKRAKQSSLAATKKQMSRLRKDRIGAYHSSIERLKSGVFFAENMKDHTKFIMGGVNARFRRATQK